MKIIAFSDYRVQNIPKTLEFVSKQKPDLILYAGDDVNRFGPLPKKGLKKISIKEKHQEGFFECFTPSFDTWDKKISDDSINKTTQSRILSYCLSFNTTITKKISQSAIRSKLYQIFENIKTTSIYEPGNRLKFEARFQETTPLKLIENSTIVYKNNKNSVYGLMYFPEQTTDYIQKFSSITKHGFFGVIGNDDDPIYKSLLVGNGKHDLHESAKIVNDIMFLGQESDSVSEEGGIGIKIYSESEIEEHLNDLLKNTSIKNSILVSHTPPFGVLDHATRFGSKHVGSHAVRKFIDEKKPILVLCGHVHSHGGCISKIDKTTVINLASHDYENSPGRICTIEISKDLSVKTEWHLIFDDKTIPYTPCFLAEKEILNSVYNLNGVGIKTAERLEIAGFRTIEDIINSGENELQRKVGLSPSTAKKMILKAQSSKQGEVISIGEFVIPKSNLLFIDIETNLSQSYIWLISIYVEDEKILKQFYARKPNDEKKILKQFIEFCKKYPNHVFCHYSGTYFDERIIKERLNHYEFDLDIGNWFDLYLAIKQSIILPIKSYSLKNIGSYCDYIYKDRELDGKTVAKEYELTIKNRAPKISKKFLDYAKDDVMVLDQIMRKLTKNTGIKIQKTLEFHTDSLPVDFEEECIKLQKLKKNGIKNKQICLRYNKSEDYVKTRLNSNIQEFKNRKIKFQKYSLKKHKHISYSGIILKQLSPNQFKIKSKTKIIILHKKQFQII